MLFFGLLFLLTAIYALVKGKLFHSLILESVTFEVKKARGESVELPKDFNYKLIYMMLYLTFLAVAQAIFIYNSLKLDPFVYPTLAYIGIIFFNILVNSFAKKKDLTTEEGRTEYLYKHKKRFTLRGFLSKIINIVYFSYIVAVLLELIK